MRSILISENFSVKFEAQLSEMLGILASRGEEILDIKFSTSASDNHCLYSALILIKN